MSHCNHINIQASSVDYEMSRPWLNFSVVEIQVEEYNWLIEFSLNRVQHKEPDGITTARKQMMEI